MKNNTKKTPWFETLHVDLDSLNAFEAKRGFTWDEGNPKKALKKLKSKIKNNLRDLIKDMIDSDIQLASKVYPNGKVR